MDINKTIRYGTSIVALLVSATMLFCCKENIPHNTLGIGRDVPDQSVKELVMTYASNNKIRYIIRTPQVRSFTNLEQPYNEFPKGGYVEAYNDSAMLETTIFSKYAIQHQKPTEIWMATDSVVVHNLIKDQWLLTDTIYWDIEKKELYTNRPVTIITPDMTLRPENGMRSDDRFRNYELHTIRRSELLYNNDRFEKKDSTQ